MSEQLQNCYKLLDIIDNEKWNCDFNQWERRTWYCRTYRCLLGHYAYRVYGLKGERLIDWCGFFNAVNEFGLHHHDDVATFDRMRFDSLFGEDMDGGDINDRRAALLKHIHYLESQERNFSAELMEKIKSMPPLLEKVV